MAVYKRSYRPYQGPLTSERWRFLVVPRYALQELVESRNLVAFVVMCLFPFLAEAVGIYVANFPPARALLRISGMHCASCVATVERWSDGHGSTTITAGNSHSTSAHP